MKTITNYTVVKGDTLSAIARRFGTTVERIKTLNKLTSTALKIGQVLKVEFEQEQPPAKPTTPPKPTTPTKPATPDKPTTNTTTTATYTVVKGDTLSAISRRFGMTVDELKKLNGLTSTALKIGQVLKVKGATPPPPVKPEPPKPEPTKPETPKPPVTPPPPVDPTPPGDALAARKLFALEVRPDNGYNRFFLTVPLLDGRSVRAAMRDNLTNSSFMVYPHGIMYGGQSKVELDLPSIESVGLNHAQARALQYISTHEGNFDAINTYDKGIFSYGFIQFVAASASGASLNRVLASMKANQPALFARVFQRVGIDSVQGATTVLDDKSARLTGDDAWLYIQRNVQLYAPFIQAGFEPLLIREQLRMANELYVQPALNFRLTLTVGGLTVRIPRLRDLISSEGMLTAVFALAVSRGVGGMSQLIGNTVSEVAAREKAQDLPAVQRLPERLFAEQLAQYATDGRVRARAQGVIDEGMSFEKATT